MLPVLAAKHTDAGPVVAQLHSVLVTTIAFLWFYLGFTGESRLIDRMPLRPFSRARCTLLIDSCGDVNDRMCNAPHAYGEMVVADPGDTPTPREEITPKDTYCK